MQDLIDAEATTKIGAGPYERTEHRVTGRNGTRPKTLATPAEQLDLAIPKLREGSFFPSLLHPRRRVDKALYSVIFTAWIEGVSTRKVDELVKALGNETGISKSSVSRICGDIDEVVNTFMTRSLDHTWFPYLYLDATYPTSASRAMSSPKRSWSRSGSLPSDAARSWAWPSQTANRPTSGPGSSAACANAA